MTFQSIDPTTGTVVATQEALDASQREALLARVHAEQRRWRDLALADRARAIRALGAALRRSRASLADALTAEMGKPTAAALAEVDKCAQLCDWAAGAAADALADERPIDDALTTVRLSHRPLGVVLGIMPWNFPYWQALRLAVPTLLAGNGVLLKPAPSVPRSAGRLEHVLREADTAIPGVPPIPCRTAFLAVDDIDALIADPRIAGVSLTGSDRAGRQVAAMAGRSLKRVALELGGSDPFIVFPDADVDRAAAVGALARTVNAGQSCIAAKRFVVCDAVYDRFLARFTEAMRALVVGDPRDPRTSVGPLASHGGREALHRQVCASVAAGARVLLGGVPLDGPGAFYPPTVLVDVPDDAPAACEELFGPVAAVFRVADADAAIARADATRFGLGASLWTRDPALVERCARELDTGMLVVNDMVVSDPRIPFGGVRDSGFGRELGGAGFREFTNLQVLRVASHPTG
jgi:succinate-semialdehyde dehydrogenase/glutarate-semialdehyde dehydrogenase